MPVMWAMRGAACIGTITGRFGGSCGLRQRGGLAHATPNAIRGRGVSLGARAHRLRARAVETKDPMTDMGDDSDDVKPTADALERLIDLPVAPADHVTGGNSSEEGSSGGFIEGVKEKLGSERLQGVLLLNLGAALFASNQVVIKEAEEILSPEALTAGRFLVAAVAFAPQIVKGVRKPELRKAAGELGLWLLGGYTAQALGLSLTSAANSSFTGAFTVLTVPILVGLSGRTVAPVTWAACVTAILGVSLLTTDGSPPNIGDAWCIFSAVMFGVHKFRTEAVTARFSETRELMAVQLGVVALLASGLALPGAIDWFAAQDSLPAAAHQVAGTLPPLVYMGLVTTAFTLWIEVHALKSVSAPTAAIIYTAEPLWGALFAWTLLGDRWGPMGWVGAAMIVGSSLGSQLIGEKKGAEEGEEGQEGGGGDGDVPAKQLQ